ncbi:MAG: rhodanese-like domain-containing protein [Bauldia sp.]
MKTIDAEAAAQLMEGGALMVDVREAGEFAQARIPGSVNVALSEFEASDIPAAEGQPVVFFCQSGNRTRVHAARLAARNADAYVLGGGIIEWAQAGLPIETGSD